MIEQLPRFRDKKGRFKRGWALNSKGYPRYYLRPFRNQYVHRVQAAVMIGRLLTADEDVHHKNSNKTDFRRRNLCIMGHVEHGCVSAKQHHYLASLDIHLKAEWDSWFEAEQQVPF